MTGFLRSYAILNVYVLGYTQAFHTNRINLSPFTKDFRVWETLIETIRIISISF